jgi:DNA-directed RNA polymerase specialized sigma24 family protein
MEKLYARQEHGGHPVFVLSGSYRVDWPGGPKAYPSARQLLIALVNRNPEPPPSAPDPRISFDRYFRRGKYQAWAPREDTLALFRWDPPRQVSAPLQGEPRLKDYSLSIGVGVASNPLGIDLAKRGVEVRKLFWAGFGRKVMAQGYDPEDVLQEIYVALEVRNRGKCPFDPRKSSFSHYVYMVCGCVCSNYHRRWSRHARGEQYGVSGADGELIDVGASDLAREEATQEGDLSLAQAQEALTVLARREALLSRVDPGLAVSCIQALHEGKKYREISEETGFSIGKVSEAVGLVRRVARRWRDGD